MKLNQLSGIAAIALFAAPLLWASTTPASAATTCPTGDYDLYNPATTPGGSGSITCTTNNLQFSNFNFDTPASTGGALLPTPASVSVTPITTLMNEGFDFNPNFTEGPRQSQDLDLTFQVTALNGFKITDLSIFFNGSFSGDGSTTFSETYCTISFTQGCNNFQVNNPPPNLQQTIDIPATTTLFITKDMGASGGTTGSAHISDVENQFSNVPAPLIGHGLLVVLAVGGVLFGGKLLESLKKRDLHAA